MNDDEQLDVIKTYIKENNPRKQYSHIKFDIEADVYFSSTEEGGRSSPAIIGYRPNHLVKPKTLTTGLHVYLEQDFVFPGHTATTGIKFLSPDAYPHCLEVNMKINIQEGSHIVGYAKITKIFNQVLQKIPS